MAVYYINSYDITDMPAFSKYTPPLIALLRKYGAEVLAADLEGIAIEGSPRQMNAIVKFPSEEAALRCYSDPEYQPLKAIRQSSVSNCTMVLVKGSNS